MMKRYIFLFILFVMSVSSIFAQAPLTGYHSESFVLQNKLNPAFMPEYDHVTLPLLGCTSVGIESSMGMGDLLFDRADGRLSLFTSSGTISKSRLMKSVGSALKTSAEASLTLFSIGRHYRYNAYRTLDVTFHNVADVRVDKSLFDCVKDIENRSYSIENTGVSASSYLDISLGQSNQIDDHWSLGGKVKLLVGLANADVRLNHMNLNLSNKQQLVDGEYRKVWTAEGDASMQVSGFEYKKEYREYKNEPGGYNKVTGVKLGGFGIHGFGVGADLGAVYKLNPQWTFSASLLDLGFITWYGARQAKTTGKSVLFDGFQNANADDDDPDGLKNQWNELQDDISDFAHLEEQDGRTTHTNMLNMTFNLGASYTLDLCTLGALFTTRTHYGYSNIEWRVSADFNPWYDWNIVVSPAYQVYNLPDSHRFKLGAMVSYHPGRYQFYIASDNLFWKVNRQMIPTSLNGGIQFGAVMYY